MWPITLIWKTSCDICQTIVCFKLSLSGFFRLIFWMFSGHAAAEFADKVMIFILNSVSMVVPRNEETLVSRYQICEISGNYVA